MDNGIAYIDSSGHLAVNCIIYGNSTKVYINKVSINTEIISVEIEWDKKFADYIEACGPESKYHYNDVILWGGKAVWR